MATGVLNIAPKDNEVATYTATQAKASLPKSVGYAATPFTVGKQSTVSGQLDTILRKDSPLLQQARTRAAQKANQRGLLNTSMAIGAGEEAVISQALPIAQQDATTFGTAETKTTDAENAAKYFKAQSDNAASMRGAELETNVSQFNADATTKADATTAGAANQFKQTDKETTRAYNLADKDTARALQLADKDLEKAMATATLDAQTRMQLATMDHNTRMALANVDRQTRVELAGIENNYRVLLQTNQDLATMYNQVSTNIANIAMSNLSPEAKASATQTQLNHLNEALKAKQNVGTSRPSPSTPAIQGMNISQYFQASVSKPAGSSTGSTSTPSTGTLPKPSGSYTQQGTAPAPGTASGGGSSVPSGARPAGIPNYAVDANQMWGTNPATRYPYPPGSLAWQDPQNGNMMVYQPGIGISRIPGYGRG